jgi:flagellar secretion chaperone FliS
MYGPAPNQYQSQAVETATPAQLVLMLYDRILVGVLRARQATERDVVNAELQRIQRILTELMVTLDRERGGDIAARLESLYEFSRDRVIQANIKQELGLLDDVEHVIGELRDAWEQSCVNNAQAVAALR